MPEWLVFTLFFVAFFAVACIVGTVNRRHAFGRTLARRPNPDRAAFIALLAGDVRPETAQYLWDKIADYVGPLLTPHPDDHLYDDLLIDDDDPVMDWLPEFAEIHGLEWKGWPDWPADWDSNVRNFVRWLEMGLVSPHR